MIITFYYELYSNLPCTLEIHCTTIAMYLSDNYAIALYQYPSMTEINIDIRGDVEVRGNEVIVKVEEIKSSASHDAVRQGYRQLYIRLSFIAWSLFHLGYRTCTLVGILFIPKVVFSTSPSKPKGVLFPSGMSGMVSTEYLSVQRKAASIMMLPLALLMPSANLQQTLLEVLCLPMAEHCVISQRKCVTGWQRSTATPKPLIRQRRVRSSSMSLANPAGPSSFCA